MISEDFFKDGVVVEDGYPVEQRVLNRGLLERIRANAYTDRPDMEVATALLRLAHDELLAFATDRSQRTDDEDMRLILRTARRLVKRLEVSFQLPFSDYGSFHAYWEENNCYGSWAARRGVLRVLFEPVHRELADREDDELEASLAQPITSHSGTGWPEVDKAIKDLRRHFRDARSSLDYRNIGNDCDAVLERLSETLFDPELHLKEREQVPPVSQTKNRIGRFVEVAAPDGRTNERIRKLANATIDLAQAVKHNQEGTRRNAGIAADSVILLANLLRRFAEE